MPGRFIKPVVFLVAVAALFSGGSALAADGYGSLGSVSPRATVWFIAQLHLYFAAFILAVPIFVIILEAAGVVTKDSRYDTIAKEFIKVSIAAHVITVMFGIIFAVALFSLYPSFMGYMTKIFKPTYFVYIALFLVNTVLLYVYAFKWDAMQGNRKSAHIVIGVLLNCVGTIIMLIATAWTTFMMTPSGVNESGELTGSVFSALNNPLSLTMSVHRFVANISFGGSILGAYAAYRFLSSVSAEDKALYDWMGHKGSFIAIASLLPLPFVGYWHTAAVYAYSQEMGMTLMGGAFGWMFIVQAVLIGSIFLSANYYLWCAMSRGGGCGCYTPHLRYIAPVLAVCFMVWFTPHTPTMTTEEVKAIGGQYHPILGPLGLMPAKNIAINVMILFTFISYLLYRRSNLKPVTSWAEEGKAAQAAIIVAAITNVIFLGVYYGYFTDNSYKMAASVPQVITTMSAIIACSIIDYLIFRNATPVEELKWGRVPERSQYALIMLAVSFTWLMGLMGFIRSAIRQNWHVYSVIKDTSVEAFTPSIQYTTRVVSIATIVFMALALLVFRIAMARRRKD